MLDKILGKKDKDKNDTPDLRKNGKKSDSDNSDIGGRLKDMVGKVSGNKKDDDKAKSDNKKAPSDNIRKARLDNGDRKDSSDKKIPRPMPKPKPAMEKPRLRTPEKKKPGGLTAGLGGGFGKKLPEDDQRTLVGAAVFGIILIILVGAGYYFIIYAPYEQSLNNAKMTQIGEVNSYFTGPLASSPQVSMLLAEIDAAVTPAQASAVDVLGPATTAWREYQNQQIANMTDPYGRVMISYTPTGSATPSTMIYKVAAAETLVNESDANVLLNMAISTPDTVAIPVYISRLQAAGGLINVGDTVDIYQNVNTSSSSNSSVESTNSDTPPVISGVTVLAILDSYQWRLCSDFVQYEHCYSKQCNFDCFNI